MLAPTRIDQGRYRYGRTRGGTPSYRGNVGMGAASARDSQGNAGWAQAQSSGSGFRDTGNRNPVYGAPIGQSQFYSGASGKMGGYNPPSSPGVDQDLENRALQAALDRIRAEYGIRIAEPQSALNSMAGQYQQAMAANSLQFGDATRQQNSSIAGRGLLRSGVRNTEMQRAYAPIESERRNIQNTMAYGEGVDEKDYGTNVLQLQAAIEQLRGAQSNAELERRIQAEQGGLQHRLAMANPGG